MGGKAADIKQDSCDLAILAFGSELHPEMRGRKEHQPSLIFPVSWEASEGRRGRTQRIISLRRRGRGPASCCNVWGQSEMTE